MRVSERGGITIPKKLRERFGLNHNVEMELTPAQEFANKLPAASART